MLQETRTAIKRASAGIEEARGLPNACYTDTTMFEHEREAVFAKGGRASALRKTLLARAMPFRSRF